MIRMSVEVLKRDIMSVNANAIDTHYHNNSALLKGREKDTFFS